MKLSDLLNPLYERKVSVAIPVENDLEDIEIKSIHYDSRKVKPGGLFVALTGFHTDGHDHINDAVGRGAVALLVDRPMTAPVAILQVPNTRQSLAALAARFYGYPSRELVVIGITGTNGKTTTSYLIENILAAAGLKVGVIGTINYRFGGKKADAPVTTPEALDLQRILRRMRTEKVTHVVMEVSSHALALNRIDGCELDVAVFTNLSQDHLDFHKDMIGYWACKKRLFTEILSIGPKQAIARAVINRDDPRGDQLARELALPVVTVGLGEENNVRPIQVDMGQNGIRGSLHLENNIVGHAPAHLRFHSSLTGEFNLENILCAAGACAAIN
ncbi:MAG: UDP-N-acetylmuramoyl-L-alanyl-D-glutamate--2,6-diaminopimelate ligase, partial [Thermodesulfobacteriota bacterium]|nr:UDP-N-acetylmuramoyl-L-alanyl-D-glutamate--2,6-diaminopimelate ligase [Thermodesulfobacteriota bacterium]